MIPFKSSEIPLFNKLNLEIKVTKKDVVLEIYRWAYDQYWDQCSRECVVWLGGPSGDIMKPYSLVFGWHSYAKDKERDHVTLTSSHGLRVEGLHTLPNMSFSSKIALSPGFEFRNNHHVQPGKSYVPEKKVYIACIQTDCLGWRVMSKIKPKNINSCMFLLQHIKIFKRI